MSQRFRACPNIILFFILFLAGCSVYKSTMRKDFEGSTSSSRLAASSTTPQKSQEPTHNLIAHLKTANCSTYDIMTAWLLRSFPTLPSELINSSQEEKSEIWLQKHSNGFVSFKFFKFSDSTVEICTTEPSPEPFANAQ